MSGKEVVDLTDIWTRKSEKSAGPETKQFSALLSIKSIDEKNRRIKAVASTGNIDRDGEIILPEAFTESLPLFMKNPVVLASHQHRLDSGHSPVVANIVSANVTSAGLEVDLEFHDITELAEEYWQLYSQKKQKALSVGFIPIEGNYEQRKSKSVFVHKKVELIEISCVPVGSNREALTRSQQKKLDFVSDKRQEREDEKFLDEIRAENPDFDAKCMEFAEMLYYGEIPDDEVELDFDFISMKSGSEDNEFVRLVKGL